MTLPNESSSLTRGEKTKYRLAESMKECMCHTPVDAITVRQITENCGLTRQTFYRNFMDKFDLKKNFSVPPSVMTGRTPCGNMIFS